MAAKPRNWWSQSDSASHGGNSFERGGGPCHRLDLVDVDGLEEGLSGGEVSVERADSDPGPIGHLLERCRGAFVGEEGAGSRHELFVVRARVGALRAVRLELGLAHSITVAVPPRDAPASRRWQMESASSCAS